MCGEFRRRDFNCPGLDWRLIEDGYFCAQRHDLAFAE